ncbi:hypothetical protein [Pelomicrobium methylotrophicum]|uniref:Capsule biosynthesis protein n=1 Tax=Pelomicrobium methylotrophicum TaxID=2602750 RepID=A0A5C7ERP9_9PROT|nr:hypothetical protein [Pelomicrobium methylotrophicum]TXF10925.1 hypothetical protein FR698_12655 [Pelomicrobium methylotrophicum]
MREVLPRVNKLFIFTVILPTLIATIYYGLIASDIYISESRFVIRSQERQTTSPLDMILKGVGFTRAEDDAHAVQNFILSRDALKALDVSLQIKKAYSDPSIDLLSRFSGLDWDDSFENFHRYYQKMIVSVQLDSTSSIATLTVRAFDNYHAQAINQKLLELAEDLVNKLNERGRQDMIRYAAMEVAELEAKAKAAALALARYRNEKGVIDPERQSTIPLQQIARLQEELIATKAQLVQLERIAKDNPQIPVLRQRAALLEKEINAESMRVAGGGNRSLAGKAAEYQRLVLEKEFADKMLASAMATLEQARNEAQRQQLYLERIVQPGLPDEAMEPRRVRNVLAVFVLGLVAWGILSMLIAGIREHVE